MPNRVELARPFAVVEEGGRGQICVGFDSLEEAIETAPKWDWNFPDIAPHIVVRLTAERVEAPIPEAKSGWEYGVERSNRGVKLRRNIRDSGDDLREMWVVFGECEPSPWRPFVPPCDHAHVAALLRREGVPDADS